MTITVEQMPRDLLAKKLEHDLSQASKDLKEAVVLLQSKPESEGGYRHDDSKFQRAIGQRLSAMDDAIKASNELVRKFAWEEDQAHNPKLRRVIAKTCEAVDYVISQVKPERQGGTVPEDWTVELAHKTRSAMKKLFNLVA